MDQVSPGNGLTGHLSLPVGWNVFAAFILSCLPSNPRLHPLFVYSSSCFSNLFALIQCPKACPCFSALGRSEALVLGATVEITDFLYFPQNAVLSEEAHIPSDSKQNFAHFNAFCVFNFFREHVCSDRSLPWELGCTDCRDLFQQIK